MLRFLLRAVPIVVFFLALFGLAVDVLGLGPPRGSISSLRQLFDSASRVPPNLVLGAWLFEALSLITFYLLLLGRSGAWWLDGVVAGWVAWLFRGPLLVITMVVAAGQPQEPWWTLVFGWWVLYTVSGLALSMLARRLGLTESPGVPQEHGATLSTDEDGLEDWGQR